MQSPETEDRWYVDVGGTPKMMTLDQVVEAFEAGVINAKTLVTEVGGSEWKPLKEVADLGDDEAEAPPSVQAAAPSPVVAPTLAPPASPAVAAQRSNPPAVRSTLSAWPPVVAARPGASVAPNAPSVAPANSPSIAPSAAAPSVPPVSTMPVAMDLNLALDTDFKPRKSKAPVVGAAAVMLLIGGFFGVARLTGGGEVARPIPVPAAAPVALNTATSNSYTSTTSAPTPPAAPAAASTSDSTSNDKPSDKASDSGSDSRLSDAVKEKLKDSDKSRADKKKTAKSAHAHAAAASHSKSKSSGVFREGGNANDPLNSKL